MKSKIKNILIAIGVIIATTFSALGITYLAELTPTITLTDNQILKVDSSLFMNSVNIKIKLKLNKRYYIVYENKEANYFSNEIPFMIYKKM